MAIPSTHDYPPPPQYPCRVNQDSWQSRQLKFWVPTSFAPNINQVRDMVSGVAGTPMATTVSADLTAKGWRGRTLYAGNLGGEDDILRWTATSRTMGNYQGSTGGWRQATFMIWVNIVEVTAGSGRRYFSTTRNGGSSSDWCLWGDTSNDDGSPDNIPGFRAHSGTTRNVFDPDKDATMPVNKWCHICGVWRGDEAADDANMTLYINGQFKQSTDFTGSTTAYIANANENTFIGGNGTSADRAAEGNYDDARIYGYAMSSDAVWKCYNDNLELYEPLALRKVFDMGKVGGAPPAGTNPKGPLGHPFQGPLAGPIAANRSF